MVTAQTSAECCLEFAQWAIECFSYQTFRRLACVSSPPSSEPGQENEVNSIPKTKHEEGGGGGGGRGRGMISLL